MATKKKQAKADSQPAKNREQRRREQFGSKRAAQSGAWPDSRPNPAYGGRAADEAGEADEAVAGGPDQDQTKLTGPGTGGATETAGRTPHHEGAHVGVKPKG